MRQLAMASLMILAGCSAPFAACDVPSYNARFTPPTGFDVAKAFVGRFDYPATTTEAPPSFLSINYHDDWKGYLTAALDYIFEGNDTVDFRIAENMTRSWYHGIWMHPGEDGREIMRGLTAERPSRAHQYRPGLSTSFPTWAIGFYNSFGATTFASVFKDPCNPDPSNVLFPVGTVTFKLLFTTATKDDIPYLKNAPSWKAHIGVGNQVDARKPEDMQLLQVDIGVRDDRDTATGWVFGTFVYDGSMATANDWRRLRPVTLQWGNDPEVEEVLQGDVYQDIMQESVTDQSLAFNPTNPPDVMALFGWAERPGLGFGGRSNGPADNRWSSCLSCHGTAQFPRSDDHGNVVRGTPTDLELHRTIYFRNIKPGEVFDAQTKLGDVSVDAIPLDYSLQLQFAFERMCRAARFKDPPFDTAEVPDVCVPSNLTATPMSVTESDDASKRMEIEAIDWDRFVAVPVR